MHWTEAMIRLHLDGTLTRFDAHKGRAVTVEVALDYVPRHDDDGVQIRSEQERWTAEEDVQLLALIRQNVTSPRLLADELGRTEESVKSRLRRMKRARGA